MIKDFILLYIVDDCLLEHKSKALILSVTVAMMGSVVLYINIVLIFIL